MVKKQFFIYYDSVSDALNRVARIHSHARLAARDAQKAVCIVDVDVLWNDQDATKHWDGTRTIQCVTVRDDEVVDREHDPPEPRVQAMIRNV